MSAFTTADRQEALDCRKAVLEQTVVLMAIRWFEATYSQMIERDHDLAKAVHRLLNCGIGPGGDED